VRYCRLQGKYEIENKMKERLIGNQVGVAETCNPLECRNKLTPVVGMIWISIYTFREERLNVEDFYKLMRARATILTNTGNGQVVAETIL
jgi:hypothetical protein